MTLHNTEAFAEACDKDDSLSRWRDRFAHPRINGKDVLYFTGNSLGLMPIGVRDALEVELSDWSQWGVEGHFHGTNPWYSYHERLTSASARLVGAQDSEVVCMNSLTTNLHLLFVSFYRPTKQRYKIISEAKMFPSDRYLLETQARFHGFDPDDAIIEVAPRDGARIIEEADIIAAIEEHADDVALVFFGGVQYFTGQFFDIAAITAAAHAVGATVGVDLAHAVGNVPLALHDWNVDFAAWCTYKYLNGSPGNVGGAFVHERHATADLPRFGGWWGHDKESRFQMEPGFMPIPGAEGWQLSNAPVMGMAVLHTSLSLFDEVGMPALREKSVALTGYLEFVFRDVLSKHDDVGLELITPSDPSRRGCQLSVRLVGGDKALFDALTERGVITDFREPDVIRLAPVPFYNSFDDVWRFGQVLDDVLAHKKVA
ncbi:MAG: kynureninase [Gammaproteobacteria bacterium]